MFSKLSIKDIYFPQLKNRQEILTNTSLSLSKVDANNFMYFDNVLDIYRGGYFFLVLTTGNQSNNLLFMFLTTVLDALIRECFTTMSVFHITYSVKTNRKSLSMIVTK
jgi:hypothetical protein